MTTLKRTAIAIGALFAVTMGASLALEVPRSPAENESVPQPPMMKSQSAGLPRPTAELQFHASAPSPRTKFQDLDLNGDDMLSPFEASEDLSADFAVWDSNGDGKVSQLEYARYRSDHGTLARSKSTSRPSDRF